MNRSLISLIIFTLLVSTSCTNLVNMNEEPRLNVPELNVQGGVYNYEFPANIINMEEGTRAYFTLDGSEPNQSSMLFDSKVGIPIPEGNTRLRVVAYDGKGKRSAELNEHFTVTLSGPEYHQVDYSKYFVYIAPHEGHVYFTAQPFHKGLHKFNISANTTELFIDKEVSRFTIIDDMIFYLSRYDLCRKNLSTGEDELLLSLSSEDLLADEEWIYYKEKSGGRVCRINVHTQQMEQISDVETEYFCLIDNYVIYTEWAAGEISTKIYSYNLDSKETMLISLDSAHALHAKERICLLF